MHRGIASDHCGLPLQTQFRYGKPIDQDVLRCYGQPLQGALHRHGGGLTDVEAIDLCRRCRPDPYGVGNLHDLFRELLTLHRRQPLRVLRTASFAPRREDHCRGHHGTGKRPSPHLVEPRDPLKSATPERLLVIERALESYRLPRRALRSGPGSRLRHRPFSAAGAP